MSDQAFDPNDYGSSPTLGEQAMVVASRPSTWIALLVVTVLAYAAYYLWWRDDADDEGASAKGSVPDAGSFDKGSVDDMAVHLRDSLLVHDGCELAWRNDLASQAELVRYSRFFEEVTQQARDDGLRTVDEITVYACDKIFPSCSWPPKALEGLDIDAGLRDELEGMETIRFWWALRQSEEASFYLQIRQNIAAVIGRKPV